LAKYAEELRTAALAETWDSDSLDTLQAMSKRI
jgi:hypothetical protein